MATHRNYARTKQAHTRMPRSEAFEWASFMADLLDGTVRATAAQRTVDGQSRFLRIEYDDPV